MLARLHLGPHLRNRLDAADLVQETLLKAHLKKDQLRGQTEQERLGWLRQILVRTTIDRVRHLRAGGGPELALADLQRSMEESGVVQPQPNRRGLGRSGRPNDDEQVPLAVVESVHFAMQAVVGADDRGTGWNLARGPFRRGNAPAGATFSPPCLRS